MPDMIYNDYLVEQLPQIAELAAASDLLHVEPGPALHGDAPDKYVLHFHCNGLVCAAPGMVRPAQRFIMGVWLHPGILRFATPFPTLQMIEPLTIFHPNIGHPAFRNAGAICLDLKPATSLVCIVYALFALVTYQKIQLNHGLNPDASQYVRRLKAEHPGKDPFPIDPRPLKRAAPASPAPASAATNGGA